MKTFTCNDCGVQLTPQTRNTVTVANKYNRAVELHYCADCALNRWPELKAMISWTKPR